MAKTCKCAYCGAVLDSNNAYVVGGGPRGLQYYCSKTEYDGGKIMSDERMADRAKVYGLMCSILGKTKLSEDIFNAVEYKFGKWRDGGWQNIDDVKKLISLMHNKQSKYEYLAKMKEPSVSDLKGLVIYISTVIRNELETYSCEDISETRSCSVFDFDYYEFDTRVYTPRRRSLSDLEDKL